MSPSPPSPSSSATTSSESKLPFSSRNPKSSFPHLPLFSNTHSLQSMTLSKCFSHSGPANPIPISVTPEPESANSLVVVSFYKFADFPDHALMRNPLKQLCEKLRVSGGIILAPEGINGSIYGTREAVEEVLAFVQSDDRLKGLRRLELPVSPEEEAIHSGQHGHSASSPLAAGEDAPFRWDHVRVKLKKEIVTLGMPAVSPIEKVGNYVSPKDWNDLISDRDEEDSTPTSRRSHLPAWNIDQNRCCQWL
ncbi:rhodanese-like domain-containing protein 7 [Lotus japonicus]|uniref:rhodanese-like domain-containing protein 7 n=1 Tax=Lotus japonicus TaxID=34305 RepID=UPI00258DB98E|nr:rhodanese-like domain-containing protein 7 [Lotus japonicus]